VTSTESRVSAPNDIELLAQLSQARKDIALQISRRIVGQSDIVDNMIGAILAGGHVLLVGVPGLAKTLLIQTISEALDLEFSRIQFTPDLMPSDITGTELLEEDHGTGKRAFTFARGPVFGNIVLADEINRAPPKTQAALLQAMQEHSVTVAGKTYTLPEPFFVLATQNPIEQEGTYHLPEAQLDRFMFELRIGYPSVAEEEEIVTSTTGTKNDKVKPVLSAAMLREMQQSGAAAPCPAVAGELRGGPGAGDAPGEPGASEAVRKYVSFGAGPRAGAVPGAGRQGARGDGWAVGAGPGGRGRGGVQRAAAPGGAELPGGGGGDGDRADPGVGGSAQVSSKAAGGTTPLTAPSPA
jgi:MoxR-like ATPase